MVRLHHQRLNCTFLSPYVCVYEGAIVKVVKIKCDPNNTIESGKFTVYFFYSNRKLICLIVEMEIEDRDLVGVEYPGRVVNPDNMIKTLGGLNNISRVVSYCQSSNDP